MELSHGLVFIEHQDALFPPHVDLGELLLLRLLYVDHLGALLQSRNNSVTLILELQLVDWIRLAHHHVIDCSSTKVGLSSRMDPTLEAYSSLCVGAIVLAALATNNACEQLAYCIVHQRRASRQVIANALDLRGGIFKDFRFLFLGDCSKVVIVVT